VRSFFKSGYSAEDVESLKHGLNALGIKQDPFLSNLSREWIEKAEEPFYA